MGKADQFSKKELAEIVRSKILIGISEIGTVNDKATALQKAIKKASKLISAEMHKDGKIEWKMNAVTKPHLESTSPGKLAPTKTIKKAKAAKKAVGKVKAAKKAVSKVKAAKKGIKKAGNASTIKDIEPSPLPNI